ncbi:hypothetical protein ONZ45_g2539 [Pleurotus djamor]|nr:hypothetical protein ONZ45_g2539 [Pleurotus djamor]
MSALPQDIYDIIIDQLCDDKPTLRACSLVDVAWRTTSQKLLHQTIVLRTGLVLSAGDEESLIHGAASDSELQKMSLLLDPSSHLLRYACAIVIRGDHGLTSGYTKHSESLIMPDSSLVSFLDKLNALVLPSLCAVELCDLAWARLSSDLRRELITLISGKSIEEVQLVNCAINFGVQWLRFVGPETRSLRLNEIEMIGDFCAEHEAFVEDETPVSSAPNLADLHIGDLCGKRVMKWILHALEVLGDGDRSLPLTSGEAPLRNRSWRESITTISLPCPANGEGLFDLVEACSSLKSLILTPQDGTLDFPLSKLLHVPTLEYLCIQLLSSRCISWFTRSLKGVNLLTPPSSSHHTDVTQLKGIHVTMWFEIPGAATPRSHTTLPEILVQIQELDDVAASMPNVELHLKMKVSMFKPKNFQQIVEYQRAKKTLIGLRADLKALKLEVDCIA